MTLKDIPNAISLPVLESGPLAPELPDSPIPEISGPAPAHASRSRRPDSAKEQMIQGICGRTYFDLPAPAGLLSSWESRLRERLAMVGSTESALIWRQKTTPAGASISRLVPSTRHTNGTDCTGLRWTTVSARDWKDSVGMATETADGRTRLDQLPRQMISYSATPRASDGEKGGPNMSFGAGGTPLVAQMYSYNPTPTVADVTGGRKARSGTRSDEPLLNGLMTAYNRSPMAGENRGGSYSDPEKAAARIASGHTINLEDQMVVSAYSPTPTLCGNYNRKGASETSGDGLATVMAAMEASGPTPNGSSVPLTAKRGAPNPAFPFWLMGWSDELIAGVYAGIASFRSLRGKSSKRSLKPSKWPPLPY